jgi:hypothetical protein
MRKANISIANLTHENTEIEHDDKEAHKKISILEAKASAGLSSLDKM